LMIVFANCNSAKWSFDLCDLHASGVRPILFSFFNQAFKLNQFRSIIFVYLMETPQLTQM